MKPVGVVTRGTTAPRRLRRVNPTARVVGLDIDPARVAAADADAADPPEGVVFAVGGFELAGLRPHVVRAMNVLRQYDEGAVDTAWRQLTAALAPRGVVVDGTCDESGDLGSWVRLDAGGPRSLTLAVDLRRRPSAVAARLPKALIHHNVPGRAVHDLLATLDARWDRAAALTAFPRQRFVAAAPGLRSAGWPVLDGPPRWRRAELTVAWAAVKPSAR